MRRALSFLTPIGGATAPDPRTLGWFPAVGALMGLAVGAAWWGAERVWPAAAAAAIVVVADLAITGLLHMDGLVDSADGLLPQLPRERRLAVMAEPTVGAYGVIAGAAALLLRFTALASMTPNVFLVAAAWCAARTTMAVAARAVPYARHDGLATDLLGGDWRPVAAYGMAGSVLLAVLADGELTVVAVVAGVLAGVGVVALGWRRLGGFTGDVLGAAGVTVETVALLGAAATC
ncbi:MAG: adenosylcobinamide-GDP ribazoletransferase [Acidimicrobiales bacterium]|nr:adenosylcobinamide-GDP ribazoletransferase [Acidimicrobiales bacterium]